MQPRLVRDEIRRGEVYFVSLDPTLGAEIGLKVRPVVVVSLTRLNNATKVAVVVPGTSDKGGARFDNEVLVHPDTSNGLAVPTIFRCNQVRAVSEERIARPIGRLSPTDLARVEKVLRYCLGLDIEPLGNPPSNVKPNKPKA